MNSVNTLPTYFPKLHFNVVLDTTPTHSEWFPPFRFSDSILYNFSFLRHSKNFVQVWSCA